jgi:hypothetical protein
MFWQKLLKILQVTPYGAPLLLIKKRKSVKLFYLACATGLGWVAAVPSGVQFAIVSSY